MKLDLLAFAAHPDDTELSCSATLALHAAKGKVGVVDFTKGEMGTRGTPKIRLEEAKNSANVLGLSVRDNLEFEDAFFTHDKEHLMKIVRVLRKYRPDIVLANAVYDRHPDHGKASKLVKEACFLSGLEKVETTDDTNQPQEKWRPKVVYHYIQSQYIKPDFIVDVSEFWEVKMKAIKQFKSQFHDPASKEPETYISSPQFMEMIISRGKELGHSIGAKYGEGFTVDRNIGVSDLNDLL